jgi:hypothetical protein
LISSSLRLLVFLLLFSIVKMFFDYVKVALVADDSRKAVRATLRNFRFLGKRFFRAWALFVIVGLLFVFSTLVSQGRSRADRPFSLAAGLFPGEALDGRPGLRHGIPFPESVPAAGLRQPFSQRLRLSNRKATSTEV